MSTYAKSLFAIFLIFVTTQLPGCAGSSGVIAATAAASPASTIITGTAAGRASGGICLVRDASNNPNLF
jgi:hypothetical protein